MPRTVRSYGYLAILATAVVLLNAIAPARQIAHPDNTLAVLYMCLAAAVLNIPQVRLEQGRLTLVGIANMAASLLLNPLDATMVGLASSASLAGRGVYPILGNAVFSATINSLSAIVAAEFRAGSTLPLAARVLVVLIYCATNLVLVVLAFRIRHGEPVRSVTSKTFTGSFFAAFAYSALAALLISYVLDGRHSVISSPRSFASWPSH
jgi:hypothetical protein